MEKAAGACVVFELKVFANERLRDHPQAEERELLGGNSRQARRTRTLLVLASESIVERYSEDLNRRV